MEESNLRELKKKYAEIGAVLQEAYGYPEWRPHHPPVDELVLTILSQSTSDTNSFRAFDQLKGAFSSWKEVMDAPTEEVIDVIRSAGLANQKAPRIQDALRFVEDSQGELSLEHLRGMDSLSAKKWLVQIKGVGYKTASIILLFSLGLPAYPVDTHVHRVTRRLGLVPEKMNAEKAHFLMEEIVPIKDYYASHLHFIQHGREICHARKPKCLMCPLKDLCDFGRQYQAED